MIRLYVGNLPCTADEHDLQQFFGDIRISNVKFVMDRESQRPRGFGFVEIDDERQSQAVALDGTEMGGRRLVVNVARPPEGRGGRVGGRRGRDR